MTRFLVVVTVLAIHTSAAFAQQAPAPGPLAWGPGTPAPQTGAPAQPPPASVPAPAQPAPAQAPAQPAPPPAGTDEFPPGYGPPPGYQPPPRQPQYYGPPQGQGPPPGQQPYYGPPPGAGPYGYYRYANPPRRITDRPFTLGGGIGFGGLKYIDPSGQSASEGGFAYTARLGFGLRPGLLLLWDIEGAVVDRGLNTYQQSAHLAALQIFLGDRLFLKGGFGLAYVTDYVVQSNWGGAIMGGVGIELIQGWNWSLDIESTATAARYDDETWINWSLANFAINFF
jgi:hypothetical protein